ncbi:hypothetical protein OIU84_021646 [Salix udensis]|uniref:Uncharacterized protein n=1 Tax=Salix udensis TaxID=889485 RepID=A0AAD6KV42_9ROSI|nr:hypothetical protein OIU84_021646 [Salix udensis]
MTWTHWRCSGRESSTWKTNSSTPISSTISKTISMTPTSTDLIFSSFLILETNIVYYVSGFSCSALTIN